MSLPHQDKPKVELHAENDAIAVTLAEDAEEVSFGTRDAWAPGGLPFFARLQRIG
jgi:hypothetical protein